MAGPLTGFTIGITGHRRWEEQAEMFGRRGATVVHGPVMHTSLLHDVNATVRATAEIIRRGVDVVVLTTGIGTRSWFVAAESADGDDQLRDACRSATVIARGPKAMSAGVGAGLDVQWRATSETSEELLAHLARMGVEGKRVAVQRDGGESALLAEQIRELGAEVIDVPVYRWTGPTDPQPAIKLLQQVVDGRIDALTFTCSYAVEMAFRLAPDPDALRAALDAHTLAVAVGPVTAATLRRRGVDRVVEPAAARLGSMAKAVLETLASHNTLLCVQDQRARLQGEAIVADDGAVTVLTPGESRLLRTLLARSPAVVSKATLANDGGDAHAVEAAIGRLRTKLGPLGPGIRTVPRRGYAATFEDRSSREQLPAG